MAAGPLSKGRLLVFSISFNINSLDLDPSACIGEHKAALLSLSFSLVHNKRTKGESLGLLLKLNGQFPE